MLSLIFSSRFILLVKLDGTNYKAARRKKPHLGIVYLGYYQWGADKNLDKCGP